MNEERTCETCRYNAKGKAPCIECSGDPDYTAWRPRKAARVCCVCGCELTEGWVTQHCLDGKVYRWCRQHRPQALLSSEQVADAALGRAVRAMREGRQLIHLVDDEGRHRWTISDRISGCGPSHNSPDACFGLPSSAPEEWEGVINWAYMITPRCYNVSLPDAGHIPMGTRVRVRRAE